MEVILLLLEVLFSRFISFLYLVATCFYLYQSQVAAGSINLNGTLTVEVQRPGGETAMGDVVRLVEEAQTREAPVQRLADKVPIIYPSVIK